MTTFKYGHEKSSSLNAGDLYGHFNNYRIQKYLIAILLHLNKTQFADYKILEPGCGSGDKLRFFTELRVKPENCYGFDISATAIHLCQTLSPDRMNFQVGSVLDMPFESETFDIILCSGIFDCFKDDSEIKKVSQALSAVIKDDGVLFVIDINENFDLIYKEREEVMQKQLRSFDTKKGELENLLSEEFNLFGQMHIYGSEIYYVEEGLAQLPHLPLIELQMDQERYTCAYSLWTFLKATGNHP